MADKLYVIDAPSLRFFILTFEEENLIYSDFNLETLQRTNECLGSKMNESDDGHFFFKRLIKFFISPI